jgi:hypothetical protein
MTHLIQSALTMLRAGEWMPVTAARVLVGSLQIPVRTARLKAVEVSTDLNVTGLPPRIFLLQNWTRAWNPIILGELGPKPTSSRPVGARRSRLR